MGVLVVKGLSEELLSLIDSEAFRRYGKCYGARKKWILEVIEEYIPTSKLKPSFDDLGKGCFPACQKNKKTGKVEMRYMGIVERLVMENIDPYEHNDYLMSLIKKEWDCKRTHKEKKGKILVRYDNRIWEIEQEKKEKEP